MSTVTANIAQLLSREIEGFKRELALFPDDVMVWTTVPGVTNSAGNLALHVAGGLQYLVGALLGGTGYIRNRDAEFSRRSGTRSELIAELDKAAAVVRDVLPRLPESTLAAELPEPVMGMRFRTDVFLLHLCSHAGFHLGQAGYIRRIVTGDATSSGPLPLQPLAL
jgi:DinB superfamily